jgi:hypothetical protein
MARWRRFSLGAEAVLLVGAAEATAVVVVLPVAVVVAGRLAARNRRFQVPQPGLIAALWPWARYRELWKPRLNGTAALISLDTQRPELHRTPPTNMIDRADSIDRILIAARKMTKRREVSCLP